MKLKAKVSFCGKVSAGAGQEFSCSDETAADLIRSGLAEDVKELGGSEKTETGTGDPPANEAENGDKEEAKKEVPNEGKPNNTKRNGGANKGRGRVPKQPG